MTPACHVRHRYLDTPIGRLTLVADGDALIEIRLAPPRADDGPAHDGSDAILDRAASELGEYLAGSRTSFDLPLSPRGTEFERRVWGELARIPFGRTVSYSDVAAAIGRPRAVRAVGAANGRNPLPIVVPCHRVIGKSGDPVGYAGGLAVKAWLLEHEGAARSDG